MLCPGAPTLPTLPLDILLLISSHLDIPHISSLSQTSRTLHTLANSSIYPSFISTNPRTSLLSPPAPTPATQVATSHLIDSAWAARHFSSRVCARFERCIPVLAIDPHGRWLVVGARGKLLVWRVAEDGELRGGPRLVPVGRERDSREDVTGIVFLPSRNPEALTLLLSHANGLLQRLHIPDSAPHPQTTARYAHPAETITSLSSPADAPLALSLSSSGLASLFLPASPWRPPSTTRLRTRKAWSALLGDGWAALGGTGAAPLVVRTVGQDGQWVAREEGRALEGDGSTAVYALERPSRGVQGVLSSPDLLISGWYDSHVRVYDLRRPSPSPVLALADRWDPNPVYSLACSGGYDTHLASGSARHGLVHFYDVRRSSHGFSAYTTLSGDASSPVYGLAMEHARVWGATEGRAWEIDFRPGFEERRSEAEREEVAYARKNMGGARGRGRGRGRGAWTTESEERGFARLPIYELDVDIAEDVRVQ